VSRSSCTTSQISTTASSARGRRTRGRPGAPAPPSRIDPARLTTVPFRPKVRRPSPRAANEQVVASPRTRRTSFARSCTPRIFVRLRRRVVLARNVSGRRLRRRGGGPRAGRVGRDRAAHACDYSGDLRPDGAWSVLITPAPTHLPHGVPLLVQPVALTRPPSPKLRASHLC
jgi:hypothetical protein